MPQLISSPAEKLTGRITVPGDKSISHRALIMGALALGESLITGLLEGEDVLNTARAMQALGADIRRDDSGVWHVRGRGVGALKQPDQALDMGNSGTGARLLMGLVATHPISATFIGDASLSSRPMKRVMIPLERFGATFSGAEDGTLPLTVMGAASPLPIRYEVPVASAQVKSAVMLAALNTPGRTTIIEPVPTRDHTERMFRHFGVEITVTDEKGGRVIDIMGQPELVARSMAVPGDPSSAAFAVVAALITPGSDILIENVGLNENRIGLFLTLKDMGAQIDFLNAREECGEPVADLRVRHSTLKAINVSPGRAPSMIDEYPILCVAAAFAEGVTVMRGAGELRVKESDRIALMVEGLRKVGVQVEEFEDGMAVTGGAVPEGGCLIATHLDHRIAMSFLTLGLRTKNPVMVDDGSVIETSFPGFAPLMNSLGAHIGESS
tara:strand:- start:11732 stop:13054 length:1323 start_codon:yes stop_codon:yes gene_type:complete